MLDSILNPLNTSYSIWWLTLLCAFITGLSKSGLKGLAMINIPILAHLYGGMLSVAILLPFLIMGDTLALVFYGKSAEWKYVKKLLPWALIGVAIATLVGKQVSDMQFRMIIGIAILLCLIIIIYRDIKKSTNQIAQNKIFTTSLGLSGGFATMIGNAAGPIFNLYLMSMRLPKETFIATGAVFYFILNILKVPLHVFYWHSLSWQTLQLNIVLLPALVLGSLIGKRLVKFIPEKEYRIFIIVVISISALMLFFK